MLKPQQMLDRDAMLKEGTLEAAKTYFEKYEPRIARTFSDIGILGAVHKTRIELRIGVKESLEWLNDHDMYPGIKVADL